MKLELAAVEEAADFSTEAEDIKDTVEKADLATYRSTSSTSAKYVSSTASLISSALDLKYTNSSTAASEILIYVVTGRGSNIMHFLLD